jgi:acetylornithine deacetylase
MNQLERRVLDAIDMEGLISFLVRLIGVPSLDGDESAAQDLVADQMRLGGLSIDRWPIDLEELRQHPAFGEEIERSEAVGLVGWLGLKTGAQSLILNGHVDVVPAGDAEKWKYPPWQGTLTDRLVFGRGSADMKGGLTCALFAAKAIRDAGVELTSSLMVQSVVGEEDGGTGTLAALARGYRASAAIIMEPTNLEVVTSQAGALNFRLIVPGKSAHGSMRAEGVSALEKFWPLHDAIRELENRRNTEVDHPLLGQHELPYPISIGTVRAGNWASSVPESLVCEGRFGVAVGEDLESARSDFEQQVQTVARQDPWLAQHIPTVEWWGGQFAPAETSVDHPIVGALRDAVQDLTLRQPRIEGVTYGADMRLLVNEGQIPTVLFGPGDVKIAHQTDEFVPIDDLMIAVRTLALVAMRYCGVTDTTSSGE